MGFRASMDVNCLESGVGVFFRLSVVYRLAVETGRWLPNLRLTVASSLPIIIDVVTRVERLGSCMVTCLITIGCFERKPRLWFRVEKHRLHQIILTSFGWRGSPRSKPL